MTYHEALLKQESARYLNKTADKFDTLAVQAADAEQITIALRFTIDFYKEVTTKFGEAAAAAAKELAEKAKGKRVRNAQEAVQAFDQYRPILEKKFNAQDRQAIANALNALDKDQMAKNLALFSKGLGAVGNAMDALGLFDKAMLGSETGDWKPFFITAETLLVGRAATVVVALMFSFLTAIPVGIIGFALIIAITAALVTEERVVKVNDLISSARPD